MFRATPDTSRQPSDPDLPAVFPVPGLESLHPTPVFGQPSLLNRNRLHACCETHPPWGQSHPTNFQQDIWTAAPRVRPFQQGQNLSQQTVESGQHEDTACDSKRSARSARTDASGNAAPALSTVWHAGAVGMSDEDVSPRTVPRDAPATDAAEPDGGPFSFAAPFGIARMARLAAIAMKDGQGPSTPSEPAHFQQQSPQHDCFPGEVRDPKIKIDLASTASINLRDVSLSNGNGRGAHCTGVSLSSGRLGSVDSTFEAVAAVHDSCLAATKRYLAAHAINHHVRTRSVPARILQRSHRRRVSPYGVPSSRSSRSRTSQHADPSFMASAGVGNPGADSSVFGNQNNPGHYSDSVPPRPTNCLLQNVSAVCNMIWRQSQRDRTEVPGTERIALRNMTCLFEWAETIVLGSGGGNGDGDDGGESLDVVEDGSDRGKDKERFDCEDLLRKVTTAGQNLRAWLEMAGSTGGAGASGGMQSGRRV